MAKFRIGHSSITWGYDSDAAEAAVKDIAELGYIAYETIGRIIEQYEQEKPEGFDALLARYGIPLSAVYCVAQFHDPNQVGDAIEEVVRQARRGHELGATTLVLQAASRRPGAYTEDVQWRGMANAFNEIARRAADMGMITAIHPHTGTLIETRAEIDAILNAIDRKLVGFAPDTGQIAKGGADMIATLRTYKELIQHVHLKDYGGGRETGYVGYEPVGNGVLDIPAVFDILEEANFDGWISVELDGTPRAPRPPREAAAMSKRYLEELLGDRAEW